MVGVAIARRVLDLLGNLAKSDTRTALSLITLPVPMPATLLRHIDQRATRVTKGKAKADDAAAGAALTAPLPELQGSLPAVQVLLGMLGRPFCKRSALHLEWVLTLLEAGLEAAQKRVRDLAAKEDIGKDQAQGASAGTGAFFPRGGCFIHWLCLGLLMPSFHCPTFTLVCPTQASPPTAPMEVVEGGTSPPQPTTPTDTPDSLPDPRPALAAVPTDLLRLLPSLHSTQRLSDVTQKKCAALLRSFCAALPQQQIYMLSVLADEAVRLGRSAARDIATESVAGSPLATSATQTMCVMLALCTLTGLQSDHANPLPPPSQEEQVCTLSFPCRQDV